MNGFVKINRSIVDWEWYRQPFTRIVFEHLIYTANWQDNRWQGIEVKRGQIITSVKSISIANGISSQSVRTAIKRLISTGEITIKTTNKYTIITICKYDDYQILEDDSNKQTNNQPNKQTTNNQQTTNKQLTTNEEYKNIRIQEEKEDKKNVISAGAQKKFNFKQALLDEGLSEELVDEWLLIRRQKKAVNSKGAYDVLVRECAKANITIAQAVIICCERQWKGFMAEYLQGLNYKGDKAPVFMNDEDFLRGVDMLQQTFGTRH